MNRIKPYFVSAYTAFLMAAGLYALYRLSLGKASLVWAAGLLSVLPGFLFFMTLFIVNIARTGKYLPGISIPMLAGALWLFYQKISGVEMGNTPLIISGIAIVGWALYLFWYSNFGSRDKSTLAIGKKMPVVALQDTEGAPVSTDTFAGKATIYLFYRGNWCPFCMAQIREIATQYQEIEKRGARLILISPQNEKHTRKLAEKFRIPAVFLIDKELKAARQLGIFQENGTPSGMEMLGYEHDTVMPTLIVTDKEGVIRFADLPGNYRVRPEPETFLRILDGI